MAIKYGGKIVDDYSAMRGPAPSGYHVPLTTEWQGLKTIMSGLSLTTGDNWKTNLHMPFAGVRNYYDASLSSQGSYGIYWSSSPLSASSNYARYLYLHSSNVNANNYNYRASGYSVRCFKDSYVTPDSTWTVVQGTLGSAGIFWNQSEGLISITNGTTGYTIMDKNLGATTVYNDGDTLTQANMGYMYQRGDNYGFPSTGTITNTSSTQVDASNYGPTNPYSSDTFIIGSYDWSSVANEDLWGGETGVQQRPVDLVKRYYGGKMINDVQGPAPYRFHIPTVDEWEGLYDIMSGLYLSSGEDWQENLHMPLASYRTSSGDIYQYPDMGVYWSSSPNTNSQNNAYCLDIRHNNVGPNVSTRRSYGLTVRAFSDSYIEATSDWTVINGDIGYPGIFWNQSEGLITISDGTRGYTIMDKNLGATTVYNYGDVLTDANVGYMYQWGNNYGFPSTGTISKTSSTQVDASNYGPNTDNGYYSSDTFITGSYDWSSVHNDNLWGGVTKGHRPAEVKKVYYGGTLVNDYSAMRGPCPEGFHVPLNTEWQVVRDIRVALGGGSSDGTNFGIALKLPFAGGRDRSNSNVYSQGDYGNYWSSTRCNERNAYNLYFHSSGVYFQSNLNRAYGFSVRCFKDTPTIPTSSWAKLYGTSIEAGGIFWSSADGLISLSSDGQTWVTIADKNLGATTVWNSGDTLSEANCGKYYQWGNNYGFPRTGTIANQSTMQVDASNYGPGNYYSSDTFITGNQDWSSVPNNNLRGGETGVQQSPALIREDNS